MPKMKLRDLYEVTCTINGKRYHFFAKSKGEAIDAFKERTKKAPLSLAGYSLADWMALSLPIL